MDPQLAAMFGQQSSQPGGFPSGQMPAKGDNESLALALASMATNPATQNAALGGGLLDFSTTLPQGSGWGGGFGGAPTSPIQDAIGGVQGAVSAINTGTQLYGIGSKLYNALFGGGEAASAGPDIGSPAWDLWSLYSSQAVPAAETTTTVVPDILNMAWDMF